MTFTWKKSWPECVHFVLFLDFQQEKLANTAEKISVGASKLLFPGPEELCAKKLLPLNHLQFFDQFLTLSQKISFFNETISAEFWKLLCLMSTKHSEEISVHWKNYEFVHFFPHFDQTKSRIQQICFGRAVKIAFLVSSEYLHVKSNERMNTNLLSFLGFGQKMSRSLANLIRHTCQTCFSPIQQTFRGKIILVRSIQFCPTFGALSRKKIGV